MNPYPVQWFIPVSSARGGDSIAMEIENLIGLPETSAEKPSINQFINDIAKNRVVPIIPTGRLMYKTHESKSFFCPLSLQTVLEMIDQSKCVD